MLNYVKATIASADASTAITPNRAVYISNTLNARYDPYWNAVTGLIGDPWKDCVLYGYAFRGHWIWINTYDRGGNFYVVWKETNCHTHF